MSKKRSMPAPVGDLHISPWFRKARAYAERTGGRWFVLSAKYGLVRPDEVIAPYDLTLITMSAADRRRWAEMVLTRLEPYLDREVSVTIMAGKRYREYLESSLQDRVAELSVPMEGLGIGKQLRWLGENADA